MRKLLQEQYAHAAALFLDFDYSLSIQALLQNNNSGQIFTYGEGFPQAAVALTVEGVLLSGSPDIPGIRLALQNFFQNQLFTGLIFSNPPPAIVLAVEPSTWEAYLPEIIPGYDIEPMPRYHYLCQQLKYDWRAHLPEGFTVREINQALFNDPSVQIPDDLREWQDIEDMWGTFAHFETHGGGRCIVSPEGLVVSWCASDCYANSQLDMGIITLPEYRRKGLAAAAVAANVEQGMAKGYTRFGWHCNIDNIGSWKTAEKVGFERNREYMYYYYMLDPTDHKAELGWYHFNRGEYEKTAAYYEQVFAEREEHPPYYYNLAALTWGILDHPQKALHYLKLSIAHGWAAYEEVSQAPHYKCLHGTPEWDQILELLADKHSNTQE